VREQHARFQAILDNAPALIYAKDLEGRFMFVNRQFESLRRLDAEEAVGKTNYDLLPTEVADALSAHDREALEQGGPVEFEEIIPSKAGLRTFLSVKFPLRDTAGASYAVCGISTEITERRRIEAELARKEDVERANKAKTDFLSRVSHELRTPLNAILGFAQLLEMDELQSRQHESVDQILKAGRHLLELINEVLEISRIEAGNLAISLEPVQVEATIAEVLELVRPLAAKREVRLEGPRSEAGEHFVEADQQRLKQVLLNLLANAVKYNREGGSVTVSLEQGPLDRLRLLISDTGQGIAEQKLEELFRPFERLGAERTSIEGTGLGLALSKLLVEAMGGTLGVESELEVGTTFSVELALAETPFEALERADFEGPAVGTEEEAGGVHTVLHVEDNVSNFKLVEQILSSGPGIKLLAATEGDLGLELAREHHPDLVLLDLHLPGMSGEEILRRLKNDPDTQEIPVVVVSADATRSRIERLLDSGAHAYLTKPLDVRRFLAIVDEVLRPSKVQRVAGR
jgi:PAS domain S-box-containing protein